jgi:hypothetical protein
VAVDRFGVVFLANSFNIVTECRVPLTLPQNGSESWEINPQLARAIRNNSLLLHQNQFIAVCAQHFIKTQPLGNKGLYRSYAEMIVAKYDVLKDHGPISYVILYISLSVIVSFIKYCVFYCR